MFHLFSIHDIKKEFQTIFQGSVPHFRRGGLEIGLIFFHKENERKDGVLEGGQMHREVHYVLVQCWNGRLVHESS